MPSFSAAALEATTTAAPPSSRLALPAVMLPSLSSAGRSFDSDSSVVSPRTPSSRVNSIGSPLRWGMATGTIVVEQAVLLGPGAHARWTWRRPRPARRVQAGHAGVLLGAGTHGALVDGAEQAVEHHRVDDLLVAHAHAAAGVGQQVRGVGHGLHAAGDDDVGLAGLDEEVGHHDGVDARQADLVDGGRRHRHRDAALDRGLAGGHLAGAGEQHGP